jgi:hypothetical protein
MSSKLLLKGDVWPQLTTSKASKSIGEINRNEDWEMLDDSNAQQLPTEHSLETNGNGPVSAGDFVVVGDDEEVNIKHQEQTIRTNKKVLRHSASSPFLSSRGSNSLRVALPNEISTENAVSEQEELDDGFSLISDVASVWTATSTPTPSMTVSFRDAVLLSPNKGISSPIAVLSTKQDTSTTKLNELNQQTPRQRPRIQPRFIVVQSPPTRIRRCSKSTGDLMSLNGVSLTSHRLDCEDTETEPSDSDRFHDDEFHSRKEFGSASRINGLKLRPDEAKRRQMIIYKKDQQRQATSGTVKARGSAPTGIKSREHSKCR